jgi:outer membrane biosynthesis protein TonB
MSVESNEAISEVWTQWQGQLINGVFPLGRLLGCSDHSGVFLTNSAGRDPSQVAIKLVPIGAAQVKTQLLRWETASRLDHPHLMRLFEWGSCELGGLPYLCIVMEYADQTLAQLLEHRALTGAEAREMLAPILDALSFLHGRDLIQGQLKPANILVVGDQLKLASDTIRGLGESALIPGTPTVYDSPEATRGSSVAASDLWGLGVSLYETLTRRNATSGRSVSKTVALPADFPPAFRNVVARCLDVRPQVRPRVAELAAWAGDPSADLAELPSVIPAPRSAPVEAGPPAAQHVSSPRTPRLRVPRFATIGAAVILAVVSISVLVFRVDRAPSSPPPAAGPQNDAPQAPGAMAPPAGRLQPAGSAASAEHALANEVSTSALHQVIPDVERSARQTIHGHIRVLVRVTVERDGSVSAAAPEAGGSSSYFRRLALEAAEKWIFPPVEGPAQRVMRIRFEFTRDETTAHIVTHR